MQHPLATPLQQPRPPASPPRLAHLVKRTLQMLHS